MAVVIRLQGLKVTAGSEDIRKFFTGLTIPDGGVHIIGGERDEAFIIFASDEDARRAMIRSGGCIKGSPVALLLSSKAEMQNVLEKSATNVEPDQKRRLEENARGARRSVDPEMGRRSASRSDYSPLHHQRASNTNDFLHVFLKGMPFSVTEEEVRDFFCGLLIDEIVLLKNGNGTKNGKGLVQFATKEDANESLKRDRGYIGSRYVEISTTTADDWRRVTGKVAMAVNTDDNFERDRSPVRQQRNPHSVRSQSPFAPRPVPASDDEYCVLIENLSFTADKEDIKRLFRNAKLEDDQILYLIGNDGRRTRSTFVLFKNLLDYCDALSPEKRQFLNRWIYTRPISREKMISLLDSQSTDVGPSNTDVGPSGNSELQDRPPSYDSEKMCVFARNLPFDVQKVEIMDFFLGFNITEDKVSVLHDHEGAGVGKALVLFRSEAEAMSALSLNGQRFLGSDVLLKCISRSQMRQLGVEPPLVQEPIVQQPLQRDDRFSGRRSQASYHPGDTQYPDLRIPQGGNVPMANPHAHVYGGCDNEPYAVGPYAPQDRGNGVRGGFGPSVQHFDGPTCVKLLNLPFQIRSEEIYDFCYGFRIIPGSVSLQYDQSGKSKGTATAVFESRQEALTAVEELSGRPIGPRKIQLLLV
ncbi:RNA binding motif protein 12Bb [Cyclopterus lumpus]|uniref:RNA binding motif protein 12Bb n=1 Tax=Cyclopterus lumpus TaxID=8103 RepID=A0A8C2ZK12_CYCLU|nr:RNA binding motif protein 12Bb [Cyclopterus lumpus]